MSICKLYHTGITSIGKLYHTPTSCGAASYLDATYTCLYPRIKRTVPVSRIRLLHCELHAQQSHTSQAPLPTEPSNMSVGKLYDTPTSCGAASYLAATYADLHFDSEIVDLKAHKTASGQDFYQINPKGNVPTLVTPDGMLSEGPAILQYIADHAPQSKLALGAFGTYERYHLIDTFNYVGSEVHKAFSPLFKPTWDDATKAKFKDIINTKLAFLEKHYIGQDEFLNPQHPSIACIYLYVVLSWTGFLRISLDSYPKPKQFLEQVGQNPKIKAAQDKMGAASK